MGQRYMLRYMSPLLERIERGEIDPTFSITDRPPSEEAPRGYGLLEHKEHKRLELALRL